MPSEQDLYNELAFYTLAHGDPAFIHQNVVDAFAVQTAGPSTKPITIVFALIGLYLYVEKGFTGKQVQRAHMQLAKYRRQWFMPALPLDRGAIHIQDVLEAAPGTDRDALIRKWCESAWQPWNASRRQIVDLAKTELGVDEPDALQQSSRSPVLP